LSHDANLTHPGEPSRSCEETAVTYHGRWRKTKLQHPPLATYQTVEPLPIWADRSLSASLSRQVSAHTTLREQFHYIYLNKTLPAEMLDKSLQKSAVTRNWLLQLHDVVIHSPALDSTISAFFAVQVARMNNNVNLVHQSRSMHVDGLKHFQQAPTHPQDRLSDETLAACMALSMYELTECPPGTQSAYMTHQRGRRCCSSCEAQTHVLRRWAKAHF
jgi:hypothetical protein